MIGFMTGHHPLPGGIAREDHHAGRTDFVHEQQRRSRAGVAVIGRRENLDGGVFLCQPIRALQRGKFLPMLEVFIEQSNRMM